MVVLGKVVNRCIPVSVGLLMRRNVCRLQLRSECNVMLFHGRIVFHLNERLFFLMLWLTHALGLTVSGQFLLVATLDLTLFLLLSRKIFFG